MTMSAIHLQDECLVEIFYTPETFAEVAVVTSTVVTMVPLMLNELINGDIVRPIAFKCRYWAGGV